MFWWGAIRRELTGWNDAENVRERERRGGREGEREKERVREGEVEFSFDCLSVWAMERQSKATSANQLWNFSLTVLPANN